MIRTFCSGIIFNNVFLDFDDDAKKTYAKLFTFLMVAMNHTHYGFDENPLKNKNSLNVLNLKTS